MLLFPIKTERNATFSGGVEMAANEKGSVAAVTSNGKEKLQS